MQFPPLVLWCFGQCCLQALLCGLLEWHNDKQTQTPHSWIGVWFNDPATRSLHFAICGRVPWQRSNRACRTLALLLLIPSDPLAPCPSPPHSPFCPINTAAPNEERSVGRGWSRSPPSWVRRQANECTRRSMLACMHAIALRCRYESLSQVFSSPSHPILPLVLALRSVEMVFGLGRGLRPPACPQLLSAPPLCPALCSLTTTYVGASATRSL